MLALLCLSILAGVDSDLSDPAPRTDRTAPYPRIDRRDRIGSTDFALIRFLPAYALPAASDGCDGASITGTRNETLSFSRGSSAACTKGDGTVVLLTSNKPRVNWRGVRVENGATNLLTQNRDLAQAVWTASNMTAVKNAVGTDGVAASASTLTATAANATILQALTASAVPRTSSCYVKRVTGSGNVDLTRDNGSTWTTLTSFNCFDPGTLVATAINSATFVRCYFSDSTLNPTVGLRLTTNGDSIVVDRCQDEGQDSGSTVGPTSPIDTVATSVARSADNPNFNAPASLTDAVGCLGAKTYSSVPVWPGAASLNFAPLRSNVDGQVRFYNNTGQNQFSATSSTGGNAIITTTSWVGRGVDLVAKWNASGPLFLTVCEGATCASGGGVAQTMVGNPWLIGNRGGQYVAGDVSNIRLGLSATACDR